MTETSAGTLSVTEASELAGRVLTEVERAVVGKRLALTLVMSAILAKGHVLLEDFPGLGKTLAARSLARTLGLDFARVQFTPDLLPADVTGSFLYNQREGTFEFRRGPLFTGILLAGLSDGDLATRRRAASYAGSAGTSGPASRIWWPRRIPVSFESPV